MRANARYPFVAKALAQNSTGAVVFPSFSRYHLHSCRTNTIIYIKTNLQSLILSPSLHSFPSLSLFRGPFAQSFLSCICDSYPLLTPFSTLFSYESISLHQPIPPPCSRRPLHSWPFSPSLHSWLPLPLLQHAFWQLSSQSALTGPSLRRN